MVKLMLKMYVKVAENYIYKKQDFNFFNLSYSNLKQVTIILMASKTSKFESKY